MAKKHQNGSTLPKAAWHECSANGASEGDRQGAPRRHKQIMNMRAQRAMLIWHHFAQKQRAQNTPLRSDNCGRSGQNPYVIKSAKAKSAKRVVNGTACSQETALPRCVVRVGGKNSWPAAVWNRTVTLHKACIASMLMIYTSRYQIPYLSRIFD